MLKRITVITVLILALSGVSGWAQGIPVDVLISVEVVYSNPGSQFGMRVFLANNNIEIGALQIPLKWSSPDLTLDSVSYVGTLKTDGFTGTGFQSDSVSVLVTYVPNSITSPLPTITETEGVIATLFFSLASDAAAGAIVVDSSNNLPLPGQVLLSDATGQIAYLPVFTPGAVIVSSPTAVDDQIDGDLLPSEFLLTQNYPNPFNPTTVFEFALPTASHIRLDVFNILGQQVTVLADGWYTAGSHQVEYDASEQPSGIYFYRLTYDDGSETKKMILLK